MRPTRLAFAVLLPLACTRANPGFDADGGGSGESSGVTSDPTAASASMSATQTVSDSDDPGVSQSDTLPDSDSDTSLDTGDVPRCGDGNRDEDLGEECDLGDDVNRPDGECRDDCTKPECGDGNQAPNEPCDDGPDGSATCSRECQLLSCGDGVLQDPEQCEPALAPDTCTSECLHNVCGDGEELAGEGCDDENDDDNDACTNACTVAQCGDGVVYEGVEQCEANGDLPSCEELRLQGVAIACDPGTCTVNGCGECGNGVLEPNEFCEIGAAVSCQSLGLEGEGGTVCGKNCQPAGSGDCCVGDGDPCVMGVGCCGECVEDFCAGDG